MDELIEAQVQSRNEADLQLVHLCILADKLLMPRFQNEVLEALSEPMEVIHPGFPIHFLHVVYNETSVGSKLRGFFIDRMISYYVGKYADNIELFPKLSLVDIIDHTSGCHTDHDVLRASDYYIPER